MQYLVFRASANLYALDINFVDEITKQKELLSTAINNDLVQGITYIREKCYPCINLVKFLESSIESKECRYIFTTYKATSICYIVDEIIGIYDIKEPLVRNIVGLDKDLFLGVVKTCNTLVLVWNMNYPLKVPEFN